MRDITPIRMISIHALRKESDNGLVTVHMVQAISIHALRKESDPTKSGSCEPC